METAVASTHREARRGADDRHQAAGEPEQAVRCVDERELGVHVGGLDLGASDRRRAAAWRASSPPAARRRCRPAGSRTSTARGSRPCGRRRPRAGDYRRAGRSTHPIVAMADSADRRAQFGHDTWASRPALALANAAGGSRTHKPFRARPFEGRVSASCTTAARTRNCADSGLGRPLASGEHVRALHADQSRPGADPGALRPR